MKSLFLQEASARGFINQATDLEALDKQLCEGEITAYAGFDPTGKSLHVGHLVPIMLLRLLQKTGHRPIVIMGGATARIGDPSFKNEMRKLLSEEDIAQNIVSIKDVFAKILNFEKDHARLFDNADWLTKIQYLDFLRDFGVHFTVNRLLTFDTIKSRIENNLPLSFLEFNYILFQAYDFYHLNKEYNCSLQIGGSDQWANILNGVELTRRVSGKAAFGLTVPLLTTASGSKMGKTEKGAVWLNSDMLPDYEFWQFWRNTHDDDVIKFLKLFTDLPLSEIEKFNGLEGAELNEVKKTLADEVTAIIRGKASLEAIHATVKGRFEEQAAGYKIISKDENGNPIVDTAFSIVDVPHNEPLKAYMCLVKVGFATSNGEARRLIRGMGVRIQNEVVSDEEQDVQIPADSIVSITVGKKRHALLRFIH
jgi:tyrosyl-tRNA synthetase